uniref:Uncharacterized protein n=1 Tax=Arundo donax TaxID=35708 RepID=A0A0A8YLA6_ARUDO
MQLEQGINWIYKKKG